MSGTPYCALLTCPFCVRVLQMENGRKWRVFTFRVPDADRTHYGKYVGFSDANCVECGRSAVQVGFVVERLRPHEAQMDKLGRWIGIEFEKVFLAHNSRSVDFPPFFIHRNKHDKPHTKREFACLLIRVDSHVYGSTGPYTRRQRASLGPIRNLPQCRSDAHSVIDAQLQ